MKDCKKIHPLLSLYMEGELEPSEKSRLDKHLNACADARKELEELKRLRKSVLALPEPKAPRDLHEKIMARVTGKSRPRHSPVHPWIYPAWGLATAACVGLFLLIQNPDLMTFTGKKVQEQPMEQKKAASVPAASAGFSKVSEKAISGKDRSSADYSASTYLDKKENQPAADKFAPQMGPSASAPPAPESQALANGSKKKAARMKSSLGATNIELKDLSMASANAPAARGTANDLAADSSKMQPAGQSQNTLGLNEAAPAPALAPPAPNPTEGTTTFLLFSKQITASTWSGNNAPAQAEAGVIISDAATFKDDWVRLRPGESAPLIDFDTQSVVFLIAGEEPSSGYSIKVSNLEERGDGWVVHYHITSPDPDTAAAQVLTHPWSIQVIPKPTKPVTFQKDP